jgi:sarcosine oxidase subunit gamma
MASLAVSHPLATRTPLELPTLSVTAAPQPVSSELRACAAFHEDPAYGLLPDQPCRSVDHGTWRALWIRPDGWLLIDAPGSTAARDAFVEPVGRRLCRIVDLSHSLVCVRLRGAGARTVLAQGTPLDLRARAFAAGSCARTRCADFAVLLDQQPDGIDVYVDTSLALAFWNWLADAVEHAAR